MSRSINDDCELQRGEVSELISSLKILTFPIRPSKRESSITRPVPVYPLFP
jgi:hypothetical protein